VCVSALLEEGRWHRGCSQTCHFELVHQLPTGCLGHVHTHTFSFTCNSMRLMDTMNWSGIIIT